MKRCTTLFSQAVISRHSDQEFQRYSVCFFRQLHATTSPFLFLSFCLADNHSNPQILCNMEKLGFILLIPITQITVAQNEVAITDHRVRGQYFLAVIFVMTIIVKRLFVPISSSLYFLKFSPLN